MQENVWIPFKRVSRIKGKDVYVWREIKGNFGFLSIVSAGSMERTYTLHVVWGLQRGTAFEEPLQHV
jgi:hypothetical protein